MRRKPFYLSSCSLSSFSGDCTSNNIASAWAHAVCYVATSKRKKCNLLIITLYWTVCRQPSATLWRLTSFVLLFTSGITERCLHRSAHIYWAQDKVRSSSSEGRRRSPAVFLQALTIICSAHKRLHFSASVGGDVCFHHIPSEGSSAFTFLLPWG